MISKSYSRQLRKLDFIPANDPRIWPLLADNLLRVQNPDPAARSLLAKNVTGRTGLWIRLDGKETIILEQHPVSDDHILISSCAAEASTIAGFINDIRDAPIVHTIARIPLQRTQSLEKALNDVSTATSFKITEDELLDTFFPPVLTPVDQLVSAFDPSNQLADIDKADLKKFIRKVRRAEPYCTTEEINFASDEMDPQHGRLFKEIMALVHIWNKHRLQLIGKDYASLVGYYEKTLTTARQIQSCYDKFSAYMPVMGLLVRNKRTGQLIGFEITELPLDTKFEPNTAYNFAGASLSYEHLGGIPGGTEYAVWKMAIKIAERGVQFISQGGAEKNAKKIKDFRHKFFFRDCITVPIKPIEAAMHSHVYASLGV